MYLLRRTQVLRLGSLVFVGVAIRPWGNRYIGVWSFWQGTQGPCQLQGYCLLWYSYWESVTQSLSGKKRNWQPSHRRTDRHSKRHRSPKSSRIPSSSRSRRSSKGRRRHRRHAAPAHGAERVHVGGGASSAGFARAGDDGRAAAAAGRCRAERQFRGIMELQKKFFPHPHHVARAYKEVVEDALGAEPGRWHYRILVP